MFLHREASTILLVILCETVSGFFSSILTEGTVGLRLGVDWLFFGAFGRKVTVRS